MFVLFISIAACVDEETVDLSNHGAPDSMSISTDLLLLKVGEQIELFTKFEPSNSINNLVTWESVDENIAFVDQNGFVEARKPGITTIIARFESFESTVEVRVGFPVILEVNGGDPIETFWHHEESVPSLPIPNKTGHTFSGWYLESDLLTPYNSENLTSPHSKYYADWVINEYELKVNSSNEYQIQTTTFDNEKIIQIEFSDYSSMALSSKGELFIWGSGFYGTSFSSSLNDVLKPLNITNFYNLIDGEYIATILGKGRGIFFIQTNLGRVFVWGEISIHIENLIPNEISHEHSIEFPIDITGKLLLEEDEEIIKWVSERSTSMYLTSGGKLINMGNTWIFPDEFRNPTNQTELKVVNDYFDLFLNEKIIDVSLGESHGIILTSLGRVITFGSNDFGQIGNNIRDKQIFDLTSNLILNEEEIILEVGAYWGFSSFLTSDNRFIVWGRNFPNLSSMDNENYDLNQIMNLKPEETIIKITNYLNHSLALTSDGRIFPFGNDIFVGVNNTRFSASNKLDVAFPQLQFFQEELFTDVTVGYGHSGALSKSGNLYVWGRNFSGEIGNGTINNVTEPVNIIPNFNLDLFLELEEYTIEKKYGSDINLDITVNKPGYNFIQWYIDEDLTMPLENTTMPAQDLTLYPKWKLEDYKITYKSYDEENLVQKFVQDDIFIGLEINDLILGDSSILLTNDNQIFTFGRNDYGQWGSGTWTVSIPESLSHKIDSSYFDLENADINRIYTSPWRLTFGATTTEGKLYLWGMLFDYQSRITTPLEISSSFELDKDDQILDIAISNDSAIVISSEGRVFELGSRRLFSSQNDQLNDITPVEITNQFQFSPGEKPSEVYAGYNRFWLITNQERVLTWEMYSFRPNITDYTSRFGLALNDSISKMSFGFNCDYLLTSFGRLIVSGSNCSIGDDSFNRAEFVEISHLLVNPLTEKIIDIQSGYNYNLVLVEDNNSANRRIVIWGSNQLGQIGNGSLGEYVLPYDVSQNFNLLKDEIIEKVFAGSNGVIISTSLGRIFAWGNNTWGQILGVHSVSSSFPYPIIDFEYSEIRTIELNYDESIPFYRPSKENHLFGGWYLDKELRIPFEGTNMANSDIVLYARWIPLN
jgi:uncharacterized repeat protein (TIGR02543 family)